MKPLVVIPTYMRRESDLDVTLACLRSIEKTEGGRVDVMVVDDGSPDEGLVAALEASSDHSADVHWRKRNDGFSAAVNVGLDLALYDGRDAILVNADVEFMAPGWLDALRDQQRLDGEGPAEVVGGLLCFPNGLIQHAGVYFSLLTRQFDHLHKFGPMNLPEALVPRACPVTAALQFIRLSTLESVGLYDDEFRLGWEDVDYCLRVFMAGGQCVYTPNARAWHHESMFRGRSDAKIATWQRQSFVRLAEKYADTNFVNLVPAI